MPCRRSRWHCYTWHTAASAGQENTASEICIASTIKLDAAGINPTQQQIDSFGYRLRCTVANGSGHSRLLRKSCCTRSGPRRRLCPLARPCTSTSCCHTRKSAAKNEHRALFVMLRRACVRACVPCMLFVVEGERGEYRGGFAAAGGAGGIGGTLSEPRFDTRVVRDLRWRLAGVAHDALIRLVNAVAGPCCLRKCIRARQFEGVLSTTREQERAHTGSGMRECGDQFCARARAWRARPPGVITQ